MDDQQTINAFAAGFSPNHAAVVVTRGTLDRLNRDELQGVIGHEFSHILNGDMRLNIRMIGVLGGILLLTTLGCMLARSSSRSDSKGSSFVLLGFGLIAIGYIGLFFARLIKAAASRQREFLADASSVQFTRNPDGIAGALAKISQAGIPRRPSARRGGEPPVFRRGDCFGFCRCFSRLDGHASARGRETEAHLRPYGGDRRDRGALGSCRARICRNCRGQCIRRRQ